MLDTALAGRWKISSKTEFMRPNTRHLFGIICLLVRRFSIRSSLFSDIKRRDSFAVNRKKDKLL